MIIAQRFHEESEMMQSTQKLEAEFTRQLEEQTERQRGDKKVRWSNISLDLTHIASTFRLSHTAPSSISQTRAAHLHITLERKVLQFQSFFLAETLALLAVHSPRTQDMEDLIASMRKRCVLLL